MRTSGLIPGFHNEKHREAFVAARTLWLAAGGPPKCASRVKSGNACKGWAMHGYAFCRHHLPRSAQQERRRRLLTRPKTAEQGERARRREAARLQRIIWSQNRWAVGATVDLGDREDEFTADLRALGFWLTDFSPATADAARWAWLQRADGRMTTDQLRDRLRWHEAKDLQHVG
jgi:hypothetical protein